MANCPVSVGLVTEHLSECREFYTRHFGFTVAQDLGWYIHLRSADDTFNLGLLAPHRVEVDAAFHLPLVAPAHGFYLGLEVANVDEKLAALQSVGLTILAPLRDEPWGERHFLIRDPAGCCVNVWERLEVRDK